LSGFYTYNKESLTELIQRVAISDQKAFLQLLRIFQGKVYYQVNLYIKSTLTAQEITQDVFVKLWLYRDKLVTVENFDNYLFILSRNEIINSIRKKANLTLQIDDQHTVRDEDTPETKLIFKETGTSVHLAIHQLPPVRRKVFTMNRIDGLTYEQIASELNITRDGVKDHMSKALQFLRKSLLTVKKGEILLLMIIFLAA
jgi:RNA polymerase sigma-70 factor (family 1)